MLNLQTSIKPIQTSYSAFEENQRLLVRIQELQEESQSYQLNMNTYQGQVEDFRVFRAQNKCLDPILFWSGYAVAILIGNFVPWKLTRNHSVFITCIFHIILHNRRRRLKSASKKPEQIMERIEIDTEEQHSPLKEGRPLMRTFST